MKLKENIKSLIVIRRLGQVACLLTILRYILLIPLLYHAGRYYMIVYKYLDSLMNVNIFLLGISRCK